MLYVFNNKVEEYFKKNKGMLLDIWVQLYESGKYKELIMELDEVLTINPIVCSFRILNAEYQTIIPVFEWYFEHMDIHPISIEQKIKETEF